MKRKILALGLFSICCVGWFAGEAKALFDHWLPLNARHRYVTHLTCRPYNAFTPICWGNLVCDGCCPNPCSAASGCMAMPMATPPWACNYAPPPMPFMPAPMPMPMAMPFNPGACCASDMPPMPMPDMKSQPTFTPPMPMPQAPNQTMFYPPTQNPISQASYAPGYVPTYYPMPTSYQPAPTWPNSGVPYYWYQGR